MPRRRASIVRIGLGLAVLAATIVGLSPAAQADSPTITVEPTTMIAGSTVTVTFSGFPGAAAWPRLCPRAYADGASHRDAPQRCLGLGFKQPVANDAYAVAVPDGGTPAVGGPFTCGADGCSLAIVSVDPNVPTVATGYAAVPIAVQPAPWTLAVAPSIVDSRGTVTVTADGFPSGPAAIGLCPALAADPTALVPWEHWRDGCVPLATFADGLPSSADVTVPPQAVLTGVSMSCLVPAALQRATYRGCSIAAWVDGPDGASGNVAAFGGAGIAVRSPVTMSPQRNLHDGDVVTLRGTGIAPGPIQVRQCSAGADGSMSGSGCSAAKAGSVDSSGTVELSFAVPIAFDGTDGEVHRCGASCQLWVATADGAEPYGLAFGFGPPRIGLGRGDVEAGPLTLNLEGFPTARATVAQCAAPVGASLAASRCSSASVRTVDLDEAGNRGLVFTEVTTRFTSATGAVDCRVEDCVIAGFDASGGLVTSTAIRFPASPRITIEQPDRRLSGTSMPVSVDALEPSTSYRFARCAVGAGALGARCETPGATWQSDERGRYATQVTADQLMRTATGRPVFCGSGCTIAVVRDGAVLAEARYDTPAVGTLGTGPVDDLADGQTISVTGTNMQPDYDGPTRYLPTGGWSVLQCQSKPDTIVDVLLRCGVPDGGGPVDVVDNVLVAEVKAQRQLPMILGGTMTCRAEQPCWVGVSRWEADATTSILGLPISFAPA